MSNPSGLCALVLAAGNGKRMKSKRPKVLCEVLFKPMICWVRDWCFKADIRDMCVVLSPDGGEVRRLFPEGTAFAVQHQRLGTGHAVMQARGFLESHAGGDVLVLNGDAPFIDDETIRGALETHRRENAMVTVVAASVADPGGYGRIVRNKKNVTAIVEDADADDATRAIHEINSGAYWFKIDFLLQALDQLTCDNAQGEYYLTDTVKAATRAGARARAYCSENEDIVLGANDRRGLHKLTAIARARVFDRLMDEGVNLICTDGVMISPDAHIAPDAQIYPNVIIKGESRVGSGAVLTSGTLIEDSVIGERAFINASQVYSSSVGEGARIGPFSHIRPGSRIGPDVKIGDFVEIKNSQLGQRTSVAHLTYVGDSDVGERVNFGCGVVTVNYSGKGKARTTIGDDAFIGCNTNLVAPVTVGPGAYTAAGSTITKDVPGGALGIARQRQENKQQWAERFLGAAEKDKG